MTWRTDDPRTSVEIGSDPRRDTLDPRDWARAEALLAQHGGSLSVSRLASHHMQWSYRDRRGHTIAVAGPSAADCVALMHQAIAADVLDHFREAAQHGNV